MAKFEREARQRRDENEKLRLTEKARSAQVREQQLQREHMKRTAEEEATFQATLAQKQEEKRQQLLTETEMRERADARARAEEACVFNAQQRALRDAEEARERNERQKNDEGVQWLSMVCA